MGYKETLENFVKNTTLNGVSRVIESRSPLQRTLWLLGALFGVGFGTFVLVRLLGDYFSYSTVVNIDESLKGSPFPDVTVCNLNPLPPDERVPGINITMREYFQKLKTISQKYSLGADYFDTLNQMSSYLQLIDENARSNADTDFVVKCEWSSNDGGLIPCRMNNGYFLQGGSTDYHTCVTFHTDYVSPVPPHNNTVYGLSVMLYLNDFSNFVLDNVGVNVHYTFGRGVKVLLHPPNSLPLVTLAGMNLPPGHETTVSFTTTLRTWLDYPYGDCMDQQYMDEETKHYSYTKEACGQYLWQRHVIEQCQVLYPGLMSIKEQRKQYPYCAKLVENNINATIDNINCGSTAYYSFPAHKMSELCNTPCQEYRYDTEIYSLPWPHESYQLAYYREFINNTVLKKKFAVYEDIAETMDTDPEGGFERLRQTDILRRNFLQLNVKSKVPELLRKVDEIPAMTMYSLIGELGGSCSLWMGISILTCIELIDLFYQLCLSTCNKDKDRLTENDSDVTIPPRSPSAVCNHKKKGSDGFPEEINTAQDCLLCYKEPDKVKAEDKGVVLEMYC